MIVLFCYVCDFGYVRLVAYIVCVSLATLPVELNIVKFVYIVCVSLVKGVLLCFG